MGSLIEIVNGFLFGVGIILANAAMKIAFHIGL